MFLLKKVSLYIFLLDVSFVNIVFNCMFLLYPSCLQNFKIIKDQ